MMYEIKKKTKTMPGPSARLLFVAIFAAEAEQQLGKQSLQGGRKRGGERGGEREKEGGKSVFIGWMHVTNFNYQLALYNQMIKLKIN